MSIEEAQATGHAVSLCYALALAACPIALWVGDLATAAHYTRMLVDNSRKHDLPLWSAFGSRFQRVVVLKGGDPDRDRRAQFQLSILDRSDRVGGSLDRAGRIAEAFAVVEAGIEQSTEAGSRRSCFASRANFPCCMALPPPRKRRRTSSGRRSMSAPARGVVMGVARGDEPRPPTAQSRPPRRRHRLPPADLRSLHGGFRYCRS